MLQRDLPDESTISIAMPYSPPRRICCFARNFDDQNADAAPPAFGRPATMQLADFNDSAESVDSECGGAPM
jgi:hypothetical protein